MIPLGYARQIDVPEKPFAARRYLMSFLGSMEHDAIPKFSLRAFFGTPKSIARSRMADSLRRLASAIPADVFFAATGSYSDSISLDGASYSEIVADTKICLAPRGSSSRPIVFSKRCAKVALSSAIACRRIGSTRVTQRFKWMTGGIWKLTYAL